ncbi:MAG: hypothetical protein H0U57_12975 [Tatlockia sp.]|nr:hypothetical protein [Tatlockia sp.]
MRLNRFFPNHNGQLHWISYGIIVFWALWCTFVALSDTVDWLQKAQILPSNLAFTSQNYGLVAQSLARYQIENHILTLLLFMIIILFAWTIAIFFIRAAFSPKQNLERYLQKCYSAFFLSFCISWFFIIADEFFIQYAFEHTHMNRLSLKFISFIVFLLCAPKKEGN